MKKENITKKNITILAIDTSCDDTSIAILKIKGGKGEILSNVVSSQAKLHAKHGGVYPALAKREHQKNLPLVLKKALKEAGFSISKQGSKTKLKSPKINLIAITIGPGLEPCLWEGINFAENLAQKMNLPLLPVNHIESHIIANFINPPKKTIFPAICLVVSGGHTQLILMNDIGEYKLIGETRDDAAGECFDKTARILGLGYPGGPEIENYASQSKNRCRVSVNLPRPMIYQKNYDFSFSGLKTAVLYHIRKKGKKAKNKEYIKAMAAEIQKAIIDVLVFKTLKAVKNYGAKSVILGGGVAANNELRKYFQKACLNPKFQKEKINFFVPSKNLCTDNAVMIAMTGYYKIGSKTRIFNKNLAIEANANLRL